VAGFFENEDDPSGCIKYREFAIFEVLTAVLLRIQVFWAVMPCCYMSSS
jgi:hypothetical protein